MSATPLRERMQEMFVRMVEAEDASLVDTYYDPDFVLTTNGQTQDPAAFRAGHDLPGRVRRGFVGRVR
jgi:hypothetical protein